MRYLVATRFGHASYDISDKGKAYDLYENEGLRLSLCRDIFDREGIVLEGLPHSVNIDPKTWLKDNLT